MGVYRYEALDAKGAKRRGVVDADGEEHAVAKLREDGLFPTKIEVADAAKAEPGGLTLRRSRTGQISVFTRQMATLLGAGFQVVECLSMIINGTADMEFKQVVIAIREKVKEGQKLCDALAEHPALFDSLYVNLVLAGEESAKLTEVFESLATFLERRIRLRRKILTMIAYPVLVSIVSVGIVVFLLTFTVPILTDIFGKANKELPMATVILIAVSEGFVRYWWALLFALVALAGSLQGFLRTRRGRSLFDRLRLDAPVAGKFFQQVAVARFARTLSILLASGVGILRSLEIVAKVVDNVHLSAFILEAKDEISHGARISSTLGRNEVFPQMVLDMIEAGQRSSRLPQMLTRIADDFDEAVETTLALFVALLEPLMILVMGAIVFYIVLAVILPIFELNRMAV